MYVLQTSDEMGWDGMGRMKGTNVQPYQNYMQVIEEEDRNRQKEREEVKSLNGNGNFQSVY